MAGMVTVKSPMGQLGTVPEANLKDALDKGFQIPNNDEIKAFNDKIEYGSGLSNSLKAFGEAAAGTATFGISRELENVTGLTTPEAQAGRAKYNPISRTLGDVAGIATPLGIEGAAAKGALGAADVLKPVVATSKIGARAAEAATALAPEASFVGRMAAPAAQGIAEGALYGVNQTVNEHALGDPDLNGEKLLQNIGYGALFGGTIGGGLGVAEDIVPKAVTGARDALGKAKNALLGVEDEVGPLGKAYAKASSFVSGKPEESIIEALKQKKNLIDNPETREKMASGFSKSLQDMFSKVNDALGAANKEARPEEIKQLLATMPAENAIKEGSHIWDSVDNAIKEMTDHSPLYPQSVVYKLQGLRDEFIQKAGAFENASDVYESLNWLKKKIDDKFPIFGKNIPPEWKDAANLLKGLRSEIKENLQSEAIWGEAGARQSAFNEAQGKLFTVLNPRNNFAKAFLGKSVTNTGKLIANVDPSKVKTFLSQISTLRSEAKAHALDEFFDASHGLLDQLESTYKNAPDLKFNKDDLHSLIQGNKAISASAQEQAALQKKMNMLGGGGHNMYLGEAGALFAGIYHPLLGAAIEGINVLRNPGLTIQRLAKIQEAMRKTSDLIETASKNIFRNSVKAGKELSGYMGSRVGSDEHNLRDEQINKFASDPELLINSLGKTTAALYKSAPQTTASLQSTASRALSFLSSKLPPNPALPFDEKPPLAQSDIDNFNHYYQAVDDPLSVMDHIQGGTILPEHIETLNAVYPKLYQEMKKQVFDTMLGHSKRIEKSIPYKTKFGLSMFLGTPVDSSLTPQAIQANQMSFMKSMQQHQVQQMGQQKSGDSKLTLASRTAVKQPREA